VHGWIAGIKQQGLDTFLTAHTNAKKGEPKRQVDALLKRKIWAIREREKDCCGQKIRYFLEKEHGITVAVLKIYEILAKNYILRDKKKKNRKVG
jgi:hypothetical protein